jgi:hypothetical protein
MKVVRVITVEGDEEWVISTTKRSLPEGVNGQSFGEGRTITVEVIKENLKEGNDD